MNEDDNDLEMRVLIQPAGPFKTEIPRPMDTPSLKIILGRFISGHRLLLL